MTSNKPRDASDPWNDANLHSHVSFWFRAHAGHLFLICLALLDESFEVNTKSVNCSDHHSTVQSRSLLLLTSLILTGPAIIKHIHSPTED